MAPIHRARNHLTRLVFLFALLLLSPPAFAGPITAGVWSSVSGVDSNQDPFWDGASWDCDTCNVAQILAGTTGLGGLEYLHDGSGGFTSFAFDQPLLDFMVLASMTGWKDGVLEHKAGGAFGYDSGTGHVSDSLDGGKQYALFRRVGLDSTQYFMGVEDILLSQAHNDRDYNDLIVAFTVPNEVVPAVVPEPSTLILIGGGLAGLAARRRACTTAAARSQAKPD